MEVWEQIFLKISSKCFHQKEHTAAWQLPSQPIPIYCDGPQELAPSHVFDAAETESFNLPTGNEGSKTQSEESADVSLNACSFCYMKHVSRSRSLLVATMLDMEFKTSGLNLKPEHLLAGWSC